MEQEHAGQKNAHEQSALHVKLHCTHLVHTKQKGAALNTFYQTGNCFFSFNSLVQTGQWNEVCGDVDTSQAVVILKMLIRI